MKKILLVSFLFLSAISSHAQRFQWLEYPDNHWVVQYNPDVGDPYFPFQLRAHVLPATKDTLYFDGEWITAQTITDMKATIAFGNHAGLYKASSYAPGWSEITSKPSFSTVAATGNYSDLTNKPTLFSGSYVDLTNKPTLFSGSYVDLTNKPTLFSGSYTDLSNKPKIPVPYSGTSNASGIYTVTFSQAYSVAPNIQANIVNQANTNQFIRISSISTTGFTINVFQRNSINLLGTDVLLFSTANVSGAAVDVLITEK